MQNMKITRRTMKITTAVVASAAMLTSCSSDDGGSAENELVIGTSGTYKPITFSDGGELQGYDIDWANSIGEEIGRPVKIVEGQLQGLLTGLQSGKFDLVMSGLTITPERQESIDFSDVYLADGVVAVVPEENNTVKSIEDIDGLRVGIIGGTGYHQTVEDIGGYSDLIDYPDAPTAFADLKNGRIDVFAVGKIPAADFIDNDTTGGSTLKIVGEPYELLPSGVGLAKGDEDLKEDVDQAIASIKESGKGDDIAEEWLGFSIPGYSN